MTAPPLRDYQRSGVDALKSATLSGHNPLYVAGTGCGKTRTLTAAVQEIDLPSLWLVHRKELVDQAYDTLRSAGLDVGYAMAGKPLYASRHVLVGTFGTVRTRDVKQRKLVIVDEAHRSVAKTHDATIRLFADAHRAGATATPYRLDGKGLGSMFREIVEAPTFTQLAEQGYLIEPKAFAPPAEAVNLRVTETGDYSRRKLARIIDKPKLIGDAVRTWREHADGYLTIVFAVSIEHSKHLAAAFTAAGIPAAHCDGDTPKDERAALVKAFASRQILVLCNVELFTEGFDVPGVECVSVCRPTQSLALHRQMIGRATRPLPGKRYPFVLDHAGNMYRHGRITRDITYTLADGATGGAGCTGLRTCPKCFRMCDASRTRCPECGLVFATVSTPRDAMPDTLDGTLQEYVDPTAAAKQLEEEKTRKWWQLVHIARERRFKPAWVSVRFKQRYGEWRDWKPIEHIVLGRDAPRGVEALLGFGDERPRKVGAA